VQNMEISRSGQKAAVDRLHGWNFNTLGAWSSRENLCNKGMPYTFILGIGRGRGRLGEPRKLSGYFLRNKFVCPMWKIV